MTHNAGGRELALGWQAKIEVNNGGEFQPVTDWDLACKVVQEFLGLGETAMSDTPWTTLVNDAWSQADAPGEWLIPLNIDRLVALVTEGGIQDTAGVGGESFRITVETNC